MRAPLRLLLAAALSLGTAACACTDEGSFAVNVRVVDAATGASRADGATLVVREGAYADSMTGGPGSPPVLAAAPEREGTYEVTVRRAGYRDWTRSGVRVGRGGSCNGLRSALLTAELEPLPAP